MSFTVLEFQNVTKTYGEDKNQTIALNNINFKIKKNSLNLILGISGSGKSTILNLASLIDIPSQGKIFIDGIEASKLSDTERTRIRREKIGVIYQRNNLFPYLNILENVMVPMLTENKEKALHALERIGLDQLKRFPKEIPIKDQQLATLSRAMINNPSIILADEPTGELKSEETDEIMNVMRDLTKKCAILIVSDNPCILKYCDNTFKLKEGILEDY